MRKSGISTQKKGMTINMKRILSIIFVLSMLTGIFTMSASAKTVPAVIEGVKREQVIWDDMYMLCEAVDSGDAVNIFNTVLAVYPDLVTMIKKNMNDDYSGTNNTAKTGNERYIFAVTELMKSQIFFDDLAKLTEEISSGDSGKIFSCILEIYPDFVTGLKKGLSSYLYTGTIITEESGEHFAVWIICAGVCGIAVGAVAVYVIMKKKTVSHMQ